MGYGFGSTKDPFRKFRVSKKIELTADDGLIAVEQIKGRWARYSTEQMEEMSIALANEVIRLRAKIVEMRTRSEQGLPCEEHSDNWSGDIDEILF